MSRTRLLKSYLYSTSLSPSCSNSSGLLGGLLTRMSSTGSTMPAPKKCAQTRLATLVAKIRVVGRGQPLGQHLAAVLAGDIGRVAAQELRASSPAADRMAHFAAAAS